MCAFEKEFTMMEILKSILLGLAQGLGEFLPISSSGHLLLLQKAFGLTEGGLGYSIMLHIATLAAVCVVYRGQIFALLKKPIQWKTLWLIAATAVTCAVYLLFDDFFDEMSASGELLGYCFIITALLLTASEVVRRRLDCTVTCSDMKWWRALVIGAVQGIAILPGISRSGATISGATFCRMRRDEAAEFSFLLSIPAILGGAVMEVPGIIETGLGDFNLLTVMVGMIVAGVSGYFAVRFMIHMITKKSFVPFIAYTAALGVFVLLDQWVFHLIYR